LAMFAWPIALAVMAAMVSLYWAGILRIPVFLE